MLRDKDDNIAMDEQQTLNKKALLSVNMINENPAINVIIRKNKTKMDLAKYMHGALFSPVKATLIQAIKNNHFISWDGLTSDLISKHLQTSEATVLGHQKQERQGLQSTSIFRKNYKERLKDIKQRLQGILKTKSKDESLQTALNKDILEEFFPPSPNPNKKSNDVIYGLISQADIDGAFFDLTGRFPQRSSSGNQYILIGYHWDANSIIGKPIKSRAASHIVDAWKELHQEYENAGVAPNTYVLDNETSLELKNAFKDKKSPIPISSTT